MIIPVIIIVIGVVLGVAAVLLRQKMTKAWMISVLVSGLLIAAVGGVGAASAWSTIQTDYENVHIALRYLEQGYTDEASYYLKKVSGDSFQSLSAEAMLETIRGNEMLARFKLDALEGKAKTDDEKGICLKLSGLSQNDFEERETMIRILQSQSELSEERAKEADRKFVIESGVYLEGVEILPEEQEPQEQLRVQANQALRYDSYSEAIRCAVQLVEEDPSAENRLLLAECIAEAVFNGYYIDGNEFVVIGPEEEVDDAVYLAAEEERTKIRTQMESLTLDVDALEQKIEITLDEEQKQKLTEKYAEISKHLEELKKKDNYLFIHKAFSSIADLHTLEASVVRSRLYYAMRDYEKAVETLVQASNNPFIRFAARGEVKNALNALRKAHNSDQTVGTQTGEFKDAMSTLISHVGNDMIGIVSSSLTSDFSEYIITAQKEYGSDLFVTDVDLSNYPEVTITLSGRDTVIEEIIARKEIIVRDTHREVSFTVIVPDADALDMNVCCVVDESGSMDGDPIYDLKNALSGFIDAVDENVKIGIVGFEDDYRLVAPVSGNHAATSAAVADLHAYGGTNISAGIEGALEALAETQGRKSILLMTDGQSDIDMGVVEEAAAQGISINCVGFGGVNDELLQSIADATGGQYIRADSSSELINVYLSLVGVIGNEIQIKYTVTEQETEEVIRYFFLRTVKSGTSIRITYQMPEVKLPELHRVEPSIIDGYVLGESGTIDLFLHGENFRDVSEVIVGGQKATIQDERRDDYLHIVVPTDNMKAGNQEVILIDQEGNKITFTGAVYAGDLAYVNEVNIGKLRINCNDIMLLPNGTLIIGGWITIHNNNTSENMDETLSLYLEGLLRVKADYESVSVQIDSGSGVINLDGTSVQGFGVVSLDGADGAINDVYDVLTNVVAEGEFEFEYNSGRIHLVQK